MAVSDDALQQNEGSRAARPEPLPFLLFMCPVATTSATHQAHKFSSLLPHIDLTTASSKEPMNQYVSRAETIRGFKALLEGAYDDLPEDAFLWCGPIEQAVERAKTSNI